MQYKVLLPTSHTMSYQQTNASQHFEFFCCRRQISFSWKAHGKTEMKYQLFNFNHIPKAPWLLWKRKNFFRTVLVSSVVASSAPIIYWVRNGVRRMKLHIASERQLFEILF